MVCVDLAAEVDDASAAMGGAFGVLVEVGGELTVCVDLMAEVGDASAAMDEALQAVTVCGEDSQVEGGAMVEVALSPLAAAAESLMVAHLHSQLGLDHHSRPVVTFLSLSNLSYTEVEGAF